MATKLGKKHIELIDVVEAPEEKTRKRYYARVEGIDDKKKIGQCQIRVIDVHPSSKKELPTEKLPYAQGVLKPGSGGGKGDSSNYLIDQTVWVEPLNDSMTEWRILGNAPMKPKPSEDAVRSYGDVDPEGKDKRVKNDMVFHPCASVDIPKIKNTIVGACQEACIALFTCSAGPCSSSPSLPKNQDCSADKFICKPQDWTGDAAFYINQWGGRIGNIEKSVFINGREAKKSDILIILAKEDNGFVGGVQGYSLEDPGKRLEIYWDPESFEIVFPPVLDEGIITIQYGAVLKTQGNALSCRSTIKVRVSHVKKVINDAPTPDYGYDQEAPGISGLSDINIPSLPNITGKLVGAKNFAMDTYKSLCGGFNNILNDVLGSVMKPLQRIMDTGQSLISSAMDKVDSLLGDIESKIDSTIDEVLGKVLDTKIAKSLWDTMDDVNVIVNEMTKTADDLLKIANNPMSLINNCINVNTPFVPFTIVEPKPTPEKGKYPFVEVKDNGGTTILSDATDGNITYSIIHNFKGTMDSIASSLGISDAPEDDTRTFVRVRITLPKITRMPRGIAGDWLDGKIGDIKDGINNAISGILGTAGGGKAQRGNSKVDPEGTSRLSFTPKGECIVKSADDFYNIVRKNSNETVEGRKATQIKGHWGVDCPTVVFSGDVRIEGALTVVKQVNILQGLTVAKNAVIVGSLVGQKGIQTRGEVFAKGSIRSAEFVMGQYGIRSNVPGKVLPVYKGPAFKDGYLESKSN